MDAEAGLNAQIEHLQLIINVPLGDSTFLPLVHARRPNLVLAPNPLERLERKKEGDTPPTRGGVEGSNLEAPIRTRGPILFFSHIFIVFT